MSTSPALPLKMTESALYDGTEVVEPRSIPAGSWPGRHFVVELPEGGSGELRIVIARAELYQLGVITPSTRGVPDGIGIFFSSFETVTGQSPGEGLELAGDEASYELSSVSPASTEFLGAFNPATDLPWAVLLAASER